MAPTFHKISRPSHPCEDTFYGYQVLSMADGDLIGSVIGIGSKMTT